MGMKRRGPFRGRLSGPGGIARRWHAEHSGDASMFSLYMILHVLFFLDLLLGVKWSEPGLLSGSPTDILTMNTSNFMSLYNFSNRPAPIGTLHYKRRYRKTSLIRFNLNLILLV